MRVLSSRDEQRVGRSRIRARRPSFLAPRFASPCRAGQSRPTIPAIRSFSSPASPNKSRIRSRLLCSGPRGCCLEVVTAQRRIIPTRTGVSGLARGAVLPGSNGVAAQCPVPIPTNQARYRHPRCYPERHGAWRSLVAHPAGGRKVLGSNPSAPTMLLVVSVCPKGSKSARRSDS